MRQKSLGIADSLIKLFRIKMFPRFTKVKSTWQQIVSRLLDDPTNFIRRSQLTEFGFCAILNDSRIVVCPIDDFVSADRISLQSSLKFAKSSNVRVLPRLTGDPSLSSTGFAFLVADSEEVLFCDLTNFATKIDTNLSAEESLCWHFVEKPPYNLEMVKRWQIVFSIIFWYQ